MIPGITPNFWAIELSASQPYLAFILKPKLTFMKKILPVIALLFLSASIFGQERNQADVSVSSVTLVNVWTKNRPSISNTNAGSKITESQNLKCSITVHNENDDDAYETVLVAILPVEVSVISLPANAVAHKNVSSSPYAGYITFNLGHMTVGQNITVEFSFTQSKYGNKVGAYAYSGTPDPNPANNYKDASL